MTKVWAYNDGKGVEDCAMLVTQQPNAEWIASVIHKKRTATTTDIDVEHFISNLSEQVVMQEAEQWIDTNKSPITSASRRLVRTY